MIALKRGYRHNSVEKLHIFPPQIWLLFLIPKRLLARSSIWPLILRRSDYTRNHSRARLRCSGYVELRVRFDSVCGDYVTVHGRFSKFSLPVNWSGVGILRIADGSLCEHWDVIQDEATEERTNRRHRQPLLLPFLQVQELTFALQGGHESARPDQGSVR